VVAGCPDIHHQCAFAREAQNFEIDEASGVCISWWRKINYRWHRKRGQNARLTAKLTGWEVNIDAEVVSKGF